MSCEEIKNSLSSYVDDALTLPVRVAVDEHLNVCPVCRAEVAQLRALTRELSALARPVPPVDLAYAINDALAIEAAARRQSPKIPFADRLARFLEPRLMPYSVGSFASVILFVAMFAGLRPHFIALQEAAAQSSAVYVIPATSAHDLTKPVNLQDFAASRAPYAEQSPTLNPKGALATLTSAYANPRPDRYEDADDMIVVADVFSNGAASLADVVHPPRNRKMLSDFQTALRQDAAFVPASMDRRPDTMRVVFSVQKVDVRERNF
ncbi:MAG TPA: zf-HC2 domain-containing protein [Pyrinomonadaceae bacterium]|nr:zf-HC2 domain-containing protein [Pyrinomonadaceae bacterium]